MEVYEVAIIGAGISGLTLGNALRKQNQNFLILEKSQGVGGRIATRRIEDLGFDHGCPYFEDKPAIRGVIEEAKLEVMLSTQGLILKQGMTKLPKHMAKDLPIHKGQKVVTVKQENGNWLLECENGDSFLTKKVVLSAPVPQALELLDHSRLKYNHEEELRTIAYHKAILALIISSDEAKKTSFMDAIHSILEMKSRGLHPQGHVVRTTPEFSNVHFHETDEQLCDRLRPLYPSLSHIEIKRWRYSTPIKTLRVPFVEVLPDFFLIGDGFVSPDVSGAIESAKALAERLKN